MVLLTRFHSCPLLQHENPIISIFREKEGYTKETTVDTQYCSKQGGDLHPNSLFCYLFIKKFTGFFNYFKEWLSKAKRYTSQDTFFTGLGYLNAKFKQSGKNSVACYEIQG